MRQFPNSIKMKPFGITISLACVRKHKLRRVSSQTFQFIGPIHFAGPMSRARTHRFIIGMKVFKTRPTTLRFWIRVIVLKFRSVNQVRCQEVVNLIRFLELISKILRFSQVKVTIFKIEQWIDDKMNLTL